MNYKITRDVQNMVQKNNTAEPLLKVGIISDTQCFPGTDTDWGQKNLQAALHYLKKKEIEVLIHAGDVTGNGNPVVYQEYQQIMERIFGPRKPEQLIVMGNHDFWLEEPALPETARKNFSEGMKIPELNIHKVIGGYDFITLNSEGNGMGNGFYEEASREFFSKAMADAKCRAPGKPVFAVTHQHAKGTVYGSETWGNESLTEMFKPYENIVHFSGHSHFALEDERSIHQKDFTALGTSSLHYCELEHGRVNGTIPPDPHLCVQFMYMEVFEDKIDFFRYSLDGDREINPQTLGYDGNWCQCNLNGYREIKPHARWSVPLPLKKENFVYTAARAEQRTAPYFPENAELSVMMNPDGSARVGFTAAKHDDFVHTYAVILQKTGTGETQELLFFSDFYQGLERMAARPVLLIPEKYLEKNAEYLLSIAPMESFGKRGNTISRKFRTGAS